MRRYAITAVCLMAFQACTRPGPRQQGRGEAAWDGRPAVRWSGPCVYEVQTRWATSLPHVVRLTADGSEWSIVLSGPRAFRAGRTALSPTGAGGVQGLVLEGTTVRGAVLGQMEISGSLDSMFITLSGTKAYRDTVPLEASCRLGPLATG